MIGWRRLFLMQDDIFKDMYEELKKCGTVGI